MEELIKQALKKRGLAEDLYTVIKAEKPEDVEKAVAALAADIDRRISLAVNERENKIKTLETELEKHKKPSDGAPDKTEKKIETNPGDDIATLIKNTVAEAVGGLQKTFEETYGKRIGELTLAQKQEKARELLKAKELDPDKFMRFIDLEKVEDSVKEVSELFQGERQKAVDDALKAAGRPPSGNQGGTASDAAIAAYAKAKNEGGASGTATLPAKTIPGVTQTPTKK